MQYFLTHSMRMKEACQCALYLQNLYERNPQYRGHDYAAFLMNYGNLLSIMGNPVGAMEVFEKVKTIYEEEGMTETQDYAEILENIGVGYILAGNRSLGRKYISEGCKTFARTCHRNPKEAETHKKEMERFLISTRGRRIRSGVGLPLGYKKKRIHKRS